MAENTSTPSSDVAAPVADARSNSGNAELVTESLVEEVSIDGMCGVY